ncbi:MAG: hypothetical protein OWS03_11295 [Alicyclobacillaceae bacterium]|nr:hypothetical protein [Alicyclobacillaceae bacterium]
MESIPPAVNTSTVNTSTVPTATSGSPKTHSASVDRSETQDVASSPSRSDEVTSRDLTEGSSVYAEFEARLPTSILSSQEMMDTEWAWRSMLSQSMLQAGVKEDSNAVTVSPEDALQNFWSMLDELAVDSSSELVGLDKGPSGNPLVSFSTLQVSDIPALRASGLLAPVLLDRLTAATVIDPYERSGRGLFLTAERSRGKSRAVRWQANRQTKLGTAGRIVHRIDLKLSLASGPVSLQVTAMQPFLFVHLSSGDVMTLRDFESNESAARLALRQCGWELRQWTTGLEEILE